MTAGKRALGNFFIPSRYACAQAQETVERVVRQHIMPLLRRIALNDGRGAVLQVCISVGLVTWEPQQYPAINMPQLARQMESTARKAMEESKSRGGNSVSISRLSTMML